MDFGFLSAFPIATASSFAFYCLMIALAVPSSRRTIEPLFCHPVAPHQQYLLGFDTCRGFAAALVAMAHCWYATYPMFAATQLKIPLIGYGTKGVPIFAVLSGFLIYRSALSSVNSIGKLREYAVRRFFRIYPVYFLGIVLCIATGQYVGGEGYSSFSYLASDLFMLPTVSWPGGFANPPTWSLYIELVFYAFLPIVLIVAGPRRMMALSIIGIFVMIASDHESRVFSLWRYFLFGIAASEVSRLINSRWAAPVFIAGAALLWLDFRGPNYDWIAKVGIGLLHHDGQTIGLGLGCALALSSLPHLPRVGAALNVLPLRLIGIISYSVYITHFFYIKTNFPEFAIFTKIGSQHEYFMTQPSYPWWFLALVFFPGVMFWGAASFLLVERPGMRLGSYLITRRRNQMAQANVAVSPAE